MSRKKILLVNLGTPEAPTPAAVRAFLAEFLGDPRVVGGPRWLWLPLLHGVILRRRPKRVAALYETVWTPEGSPLAAGTVTIARALQASLPGAAVQACYRYGSPSLAQRLPAPTSGPADTRPAPPEIVVLPLFPQRTASSHGTIAAEARRIAEERGLADRLAIATIPPDDPDYIAALAEQTHRALGEPVDIVDHTQRAIDDGKKAIEAMWRGMRENRERFDDLAQTGEQLQRANELGNEAMERALGGEEELRRVITREPRDEEEARAAEKEGWRGVRQAHRAMDRLAGAVDRERQARERVEHSMEHARALVEWSAHATKRAREAVSEAKRVMDRRPERLLVSFHSIPLSHDKREGSLYREDCERTFRALLTKLHWPEECAEITFQSRFGPAKWLGPATAERLAALPREGVRRVALIAPGFLTEGLETLEELDLRGAETFRAAGGEQFLRIPAVGAHPRLIRALERAAASRPPAIPT